jgi:hypothetical protein
LVVAGKRWVWGNSLFGVRDLVLDSTFIVTTPTIWASTFFVLGLDVVVAELTNLKKNHM